MIKGMHDIITSTGSQRSKLPTRLDGLAHMSIGRWVSERRGSFSGIDGSKYPWDVSQHTYRRPRPKHRTTILRYEPKIACIQDIIENYNDTGDLGVILEFRGFSFVERAFTKSNCDGACRQDGYVHQTKVRYRNEAAFLRLSTIEDLLVVEVVAQKNGADRLFYDEMHIPELVKGYDPSSMEVLLRNDIVAIGYKRRDASQ